MATVTRPRTICVVTPSRNAFADYVQWRAQGVPYRVAGDAVILHTGQGIKWIRSSSNLRGMRHIEIVLHENWQMMRMQDLAEIAHVAEMEEQPHRAASIRDYIGRMRRATAHPPIDLSQPPPDEAYTSRWERAGAQVHFEPPPTYLSSPWNEQGVRLTTADDEPTPPTEEKKSWWKKKEKPWWIGD